MNCIFTSMHFLLIFLKIYSNKYVKFVKIINIGKNRKCIVSKKGHFLEEGVTWDNQPSAFTLPDRVMAMIKPITWQLFGHIREGVTFPKITGPPDAFRARYLLRKKHTMSTIIVIKKYRRNSWTGQRKYIQAYY